MKTKLRILFVEDFPEDAELAKRLLCEQGLDFIDRIVETEQRFVQELDTFLPDIIISDYAMPAFDGMQALNIAKEKYPLIPFILLTGSINENVAVECMKAGAWDYVIKENIIRLSFAVQEALLLKKERQQKALSEKKLIQRDKELQKINRIHAVLSSVNQAIVRTKDRVALYQETCRIATEVGGYRLAWIGMLNEGENKIIPVASSGFTKDYVSELTISIEDNKWGNGPTGLCIKKSVHIIANTIKEDPGMKPWREKALELGYLSSAAFPVVVFGETIGVINFYSSETFSFDEKEVELLDELAADFSFAIENIENEKKRQIAEKELGTKNEQLVAMLKELRSAKEKVEESNSLKTIFLQNISHEIRTPLNAIMGFSSFLKKTGLSDEKKVYFAQIVIDSSAQLLAIVEDVLTIAAIETGKAVLKTENVYINKLLDKLLEVHKGKAENKGLDLSLAVGQERLLFKTDKTKLTEILDNLINNAIKFTHKGRVEFGYYIEKTKLIFFVKDTGIGIPAAKIDAVFERFRQADVSIATEYGGSGLGLSICKEYVELMEGRIKVESEVGKGSAFYCELPYENVQQRANKEGDVSLEWKNHLILIAEDNKFNILYMKELFSEMGLNILHAQNGKEAYEQCISNEHINLVFMDLKMPVMDGTEATQLIKEKRPALPIVALTACTKGAQTEELRRIFDEYISKPIDVTKLQKIIQKYLAK